MAWYGPRGNCGCCADANCSCPPPGCFCGSQHIISRSTRISNVPAVIYYHSRLDIPPQNLGDPFRFRTRKAEFAGFDKINDQVFTASMNDGCVSRGFFHFTVKVTISDSDTGETVSCDTPNLLTSSTMYCRLDYVIKFGFLGPWIVRDQTNNEGDGWFDDDVTGLPLFGYFDQQLNRSFPFSDRCDLTENDPDTHLQTISQLASSQLIQPFYTASAFLGVSQCGTNVGQDLIKTEYWHDLIENGRNRTITGWRYVVSDIPEFVDVRAFGTTVYRVQGLDAYNGTYDVARDENLDCAAGLQQFQLNLTAEQYDITTSTPCLETPIPGGTKDVLATLTIPPRQSNKAILNLVIDGVGTFSYTLSEDWDSYACGPQTETLTESDPCLTHTGDWLTIESSALF